MLCSAPKSFYIEEIWLDQCFGNMSIFSAFHIHITLSVDKTITVLRSQISFLLRHSLYYLLRVCFETDCNYELIEEILTYCSGEISHKNENPFSLSLKYREASPWTQGYENFLKEFAVFPHLPEFSMSQNIWYVNALDVWLQKPHTNNAEDYLYIYI
jgi:hypothetical protein